MGKEVCGMRGGRCSARHSDSDYENPRRMSYPTASWRQSVPIGTVFCLGR